MFRTIVTCWVVGMATAGASLAHAALCDQCQGKSYIQTVGACTACGKPTTSRAFKLCAACSAKQGKCEHCLAAIGPAKSDVPTKSTEIKVIQTKPAPKRKMPAIDMKKSGSYLAGLWQYELEVAELGTRSEVRAGRLAYAERRAAPAEINDFHNTPWGPVYWVGNTKGPGDHGWMPRPAENPQRKGRLLPLPGNGPKLIELNEADNGKSVKANALARIFIRLRGNPTTGYTWQLAEQPSAVLGPLEDVKYTADRQTPVAVGAGGTFTFSFRAAKPGSGSIRLVYRRPWEKDKPPAQTFALTVEVVQAAAPGAEK
jgi:inhibitor of cysteine peptidase